MRRSTLAPLAAVLLTACVKPGMYETPPLPPSPAERIQHARTEGMVHAYGRPTGAETAQGFALGALLGVIGVAIAYSTAEADPPNVAIRPAPVYADTSAAYVLAFRQAYDAQLKRNRRDARGGGSLGGMLLTGIVIVSVLNSR